MSANTIPPPHGTLGALEIGFIVGTFLFGMVTLQNFYYYRTFPQDSLGLKTVVGVLWLLELGHSICGWEGVYSISVTYYGQPQHIMEPPVTLEILPLFSSFPTLLVQWFFCLRIGRLSGHWHFARLLAFICAIPTAVTVVIVILFHWHHGFPALETGRGKVLMMIVQSMLPVTHIILAAALCYSLWKFREPSEFTKSWTILDKILIWTVETTILVCISSFGYLILYLTRDDLAWSAFYIVHPKLLSNVMMASLNRRSTLREEIQITRTSRFAISDLALSSAGGQLEQDIRTHSEAETGSLNRKTSGC